MSNVDEVRPVPASALHSEYITSDALQTRVSRTAPGFLCPFCQCVLHYQGSAPAPEARTTTDLVDMYACPMCCGTYEHVRQTHRLRLVARPR
jgi:hypothetical protein